MIKFLIDKHPQIVEKKNHIGELEIDTVIWKHQVGTLVTVIDRKSKFTLIQKVACKHAEEEVLGTKFYFAHPYSSWERGLNEHIPKRSEKCPWGTNSLIRQYLPKKTAFTQVSKEEITTIQY